MAKKKSAPEEADEEEKDVDAEDSGDDGDKKGKKKDKGKDGPPEEPSARAGYIGLGLVGSLVVGFDPLRDAFQGNGSFENAIFRFLACLAVCVIGAGTIGRMIDASAPQAGEENPEDAELDADGKPIPREGDEATGALEEGNDGDESNGGDSAESNEDNNGTNPVGSASSNDSVRQDIEQQPLTASEEIS